ncbi:MAG TPA: cytidine deaminase [Lacibacter sp.]|mgnify:FL=1|nr:cytidine deaminase [Lacibacter sp.]HMO88959.1 cytidine deaminase [Lacibacter sp.]
MIKQESQFSYELYESINELPEDDKWLLDQAREATQKAYAPYSRFQVGAVARLRNGEIVTGSNQENASFPAGLCAERVVLAAIASLYPGEPMESMAISYNNLNGESNRPITPCGICRQALQEFRDHTHSAFRLILGGMHGEVIVIPDAAMLLPLSFTGEHLR